MLIQDSRLLTSIEAVLFSRGTQISWLSGIPCRAQTKEFYLVQLYMFTRALYLAKFWRNQVSYPEEQDFCSGGRGIVFFRLYFSQTCHGFNMLLLGFLSQASHTHASYSLFFCFFWSLDSESLCLGRSVWYFSGWFFRYSALFSGPPMTCHRVDREWYCVVDLTPCWRSALHALPGQLACPIDSWCMDQWLRWEDQ